MKFTITDAKAVTSGDPTTYTISQIVMECPAAKKGRRRGIKAEEVEEDGAWDGVLGDALY
jgi:hypothetical protein